MDLDFQRADWESRLTWPDWYMRVEDELRRLFFPVVHHDAQMKAFRHKVYELVAELLESKRLPLAERGPDLDRERRPVDTIVVHHTEEEQGIGLGKLSAIGLVRQYAFQYLEDNVLGRHVRGEAVWSGHFRQGEMVFFAYHWLIRPDGTAERLLADTAIGWHAGNWAVNTSSIGIAVSGDYETDTPPYAQIEATARIIREYYPGVASESIVGHREVAAGITCPGVYFLHGWKQPLLNLAVR
jgi:hypothetical protein